MSARPVEAAVPANPQILVTGRTERRAKDLKPLFKRISTKMAISHRLYTITNAPI
jgi:hypothetical protein